MAHKLTGRMLTKRDVMAAALAEDYRRRVEDLAEQLRPRFESGELHGRKGDGDHDCATEPVCRLEKQLADEIPDFRTAYLILACSPAESQDLDGGITLEHVNAAAAECMVIDAFRLARERGWWRPRRGEWIGVSESQALRPPARGRVAASNPHTHTPRIDMTTKTTKTWRSASEAVRREVQDVLGELGPHLLDASRAVRSSDPRAAYPALQQAAEVLARYAAAAQDSAVNA